MIRDITSRCFQVDLELEKQCRLHGLACNQNLIQMLNVDSCNHCDSSLGYRPDSLLLSCFLLVAQSEVSFVSMRPLF